MDERYALELRWLNVLSTSHAEQGILTPDRFSNIPEIGFESSIDKFFLDVG